MAEPIRKPRTPAQMRSAWLIAQQDADLNTLDRVKKSAETRAGGLTAALAVFGLFGLTLSPEKIYNVHPTIQYILITILVLSLLAAVLSQFWAMNASSYLNIGFQVNSGTAYRSSVIKEATESIKQLRRSRWALSIAASLLFLVFALYLAAPVLAKTMNVKSIVKLPNGQVVCGTVKTNADGSLWLVGGQGVHIALADTPTIVAATQCPPVSKTALVQAAALVQVKSEEGVRCGQIFSDEKGLLWLESKESAQGIPVKKVDEITSVSTCPVFRAKPTVPSASPEFTLVIAETGTVLCGQLVTTGDGEVQLKTKKGVQALGKKPAFTPIKSCPAADDAEVTPLAQSNNPG